MTLQEQLDFFFTPPLPEQPDTPQSPLYFLRRELQDCLMGTVVAESVITAYPGKRHRLFATVMVIMAGIDLLAKFHAGNDEEGGMHRRFTAFAARFMFDDPSAIEYPDVLYHGFNFHQKDYRITIVESLSPFERRIVRRIKGDPNGFEISVEALVLAFIKTVRHYEGKVRTEDDLQENFTRMFPAYGSIVVQSKLWTRW